jgi:ornithine carbamoyltransferase
VKHLLTVEQLSSAEINEILTLAGKLKQARGKATKTLPLRGQTWALIFNKASTRTRVSFEVGIGELGGTSLYLSQNDIQMGRGETVADTARVLSRYVHGVVIRTFAQRDVDDFARHGSIPVINALTDDEHPCQILADLLTVREKLGALKGKKVVFLGDGACNVCNSWIFGAQKTGMELWVAAPKQFQPTIAGARVTEDVREAVKDADVLYTDVWVSMGKEAEAGDRLKALAPYQLNAGVLRLAKPGALVMHCLPAYVGKEIAGDVFEAHQKTIFDQAENRLHAQKAIMTLLAKS